MRLTWYILDRNEYLAAGRQIGAAYREIIGSHYPPMSVIVVSGLLEEKARVEIEATAIIQSIPFERDAKVGHAYRHAVRAAIA